MKQSLLKIIVCPKCGGSLVAKAFRKAEKGKEVMDGALTCKRCRHWYPVINGIPRMLPDSMINKLLLSQFTARYGDRLPSRPGSNSGEGVEKIKLQTSESFGFQWNVFSEMLNEYEPNFLDYIQPLKPSFFKGKLVLDAGCGFGRHTYYAAKYGAEVVGFDLSDAVDAAYRNCRSFDKVHIVQGDIYNPPFRHCFDFIMSIGVLHHLPRPKEGFLSLVRIMHPKTKIFAWLYGREGRWFKLHVVEGIIRRITTRMPNKALYYCCYLPAGVYHLMNLVYNALASHSMTRKIARFVPFKGYARFPFRVKHADAFDLLATPINNYYTKQQVEDWASSARLRNVEITSMAGKSWRLFGDK